MAEDMITIDASALESFDYEQFIYDYFASLGSTAGSSTYYGGDYQSPYGYYNGSQVGFRYSETTNDSQVVIEGEDLAYDGLLGSDYGHGISGTVDGFVLGYYDGATTYTQDDEAGTRSELTGVIQGLVVSGLDYSAEIGSGTGSDNLVYTLYNALRKANTTVDLDGDEVSGYEYIDQIYSLLSQKAQHFIGTDGDDNYTGTDYGDLIEAGAGADTMAGGLGDDIYVVDDADDVVTELADSGSDTVQTALNHYQIGDNVENLTLTGTEDLYGYGNDLDNVITGNSGNNILYGLEGNDTLDGGAGDDTMIGGAGDDTYVVDSRLDVLTEDEDGGTDTIQTAISHYQIRTNIENLVQLGTEDMFSYGNALDNTITGNSGDSTLYGMEGNDTLIGGEGDDVLSGDEGADVMTGGAGDDTYYVDDAGDVVTELADEGTDTVSTTLNHYQIGDYVENLELTGTEDLYGYGNDLDNSLTGNDGANSLYGLAGNDTLVGGKGADLLNGGEGDDTMSGGVGKDTYTVDSAADVVIELEKEGKDTVNASINYWLGDNVENLVLTGSEDLIGKGNGAKNDITGNEGDNKLKGFGGNDIIRGGDGDDLIYGNQGKDKLYGDAGEDTFVFKTGDTANKTGKADIIYDFTRGEDLINLKGIDANENRGGNQHLDFIGGDDFSGKTGEVRTEIINLQTYVLGDTDGDGKADFAIRFDDSLSLKADDFLF